MILKSPRLDLIPFSAQEGELFHQINTDPFVRRFLWDDQVISKDTALSIVKQSQDYFQQEGWGLWKIVVKEDRSLAGYVGLWYFFEEPQPQLLYALLPDYVGKGLASEAAKQVICYVWENLPFTYLLAGVDPPHHDSQRVCERIGMKRLGEQVLEGKASVIYRLEKP